MENENEKEILNLAKKLKEQVLAVSDYEAREKAKDIMGIRHKSVEPSENEE